MRSEAAFQRLINSCSDLPLQPRTPRNTSDRGRYPEEAVQDDDLPNREETPSDDDDPDALEYSLNTVGTEAISIGKPHTPASSVNGDDMGMSIPESPSLNSLAMDVDMVRLALILTLIWLIHYVAIWLASDAISTFFY